MSRIAIEGLRLPARIGVTEEERSVPQTLVINIYIEADLQAAARADDLRKTIDYDGVVSSVETLVKSSECNLLEHLADKIAAQITADRKAKRATVEVGKERPPVTQEVGKIAVTMERTR